MNNTLKKIIKRTIIFGGLLFLVFEIVSLDPTLGYPLHIASRYINQSLFAKKTDEPLGPLQSIYEDYTDPHPNLVITINGRKIQKTFVKIYRATGTVLYSKQNDGLFNRLISCEKQNLRNSISPVALYLALGKTGSKENLRTLQVKHSQNTFQIRISPYSYFDPKELDQIFLIPTTYALKKAIRNINSGEIISITGYLANWQGTDDLSYAKFTSVQSPEKTKEKPLSNYKYLFLTKLILNGYVYE